MQRIAGSAESTMLRRGKRSFCDSLALLVAPLWSPLPLVSLPLSQFSVYFLAYLRQLPQSLSLWISPLRMRLFLTVMLGIINC